MKENPSDLEAANSSTTQIDKNESGTITRESTTQTDQMFKRETKIQKRHERFATEDDERRNEDDDDGNSDLESISSTATVIFMADRLMHVTWAWYMMTMSTGGVAVLLGNQVHTFKGLYTIGKIFFIFDLILFVSITIGLIQRFIRKPELFLRSLRNPGEFLFAPALFISLTHIQLSMDAYAEPVTGQWLRTTLRIVFWIYTALAFLMAVGVYLDLFTARRLTDKDITPAWVLPILPIMLVGTIAGSIDKDQPIEQRMDIFLAGLTFQGLGFWVAISLYGPVMSRLMRIGLPKPSMRPGMFIAVAPPAYTSLSLIKLSNAFGESLNLSIEQKYPQAGEIVHYIGLIWAILIWSLAFWWFCVALTSILLHVKKIKFTLVWYSAIFPNVGFTLATINIGQSLNSNAITWVGSAMSIIIVIAYLFILINHFIAIWQREILWPGKDDDKET